MLRKLSSLDIFGRLFSLNTIKGSATYTTAIGGLLSLLAFTLFSIITYIVVSDYRDTTKPVVSVNTVRLKDPLKSISSSTRSTTTKQGFTTNFSPSNKLKNTSPSSLRSLKPQQTLMEKMLKKFRNLRPTSSKN